MATLFALAALGAVGAVVVGVLGLVWLLLKIIFLPIRLALAALKFVVGLTAGVLALALAPVLAVVVGGAALLAVIVAAAALLLPLVPFLLIGAIVWALTRRPAAIA